MKRTRKPGWSFVVMRGADKSVRQFSVSKRSVVAAPVAAVLAVSGCVAGLQLKAAYELKHLEEQLAAQSEHYSQTIDGKELVIDEKDQAIVSLQQEILELSRQAQDMKQKMTELQELEAKLKLFIEKYGGSLNDTSGASFSEAPKATSGVRTLSASRNAGQAVPVAYAASPDHFRQMALHAQVTSLDLSALSEMVDAMAVSMEQTLRQAEQKRMTVDAYPSLWPTRSKQLTSGFGYRKDPFTGRTRFHAGIDIKGNTGDPVFSAADGTVSETGFDSQLGNYVIVDHLGGLQTAYMHLKSIEAREGDIVVRGEKIGLLGSSGRSTGPHLHFEIMQKSEPVNPLKFLAKES